MQLVVDVGNTETMVGLIEGHQDVVAHWRLSTVVPRTADEILHLLRCLLRDDGRSPLDIRQAVLGSVVPACTRTLTTALGSLISGPVHVVGPSSDLPITLDVDEPLTVGADRIVNTLAAREIYNRDTIVVDLGTATTFDVITADGVFTGGVIAPGVSAGLDWLGRRAAKLPKVDLRPPERVIGRRTEACIRSGVFYQAVDGIDGTVRRIRDEWCRPDAYVVATGGIAQQLGPHCVTVGHIEPFLTLYGLAIAGDFLRSG